MKDINYLYDLADKNKIIICECDLEQANGLCLYDEKKCKIYLNNTIDSYIQKKCVLAEELGHYYKGIIITDIFNNDYTETLKRSINEFRALKWVTSKLIPYNALKRLLGQDMSKFEVAEELEVTVDLVEKAYNIYQDNLKGEYNE